MSFEYLVPQLYSASGQVYVITGRMYVPKPRAKTSDMWLSGQWIQFFPVGLTVSNEMKKALFRKKSKAVVPNNYVTMRGTSTGDTG